ncbi:hypothetical protein [Desulfonatronum sp. SC1]|uniref:hypothetical protein n=1 Tax=Desulfonatronum sp. SC1 TaxID=2109626 RepID=UPI000D432CE9|nr:hypothetical protein [Desulfonatronum sp. SC1]PTN38526.1 hypothetical protein C6366_02990 [Desulfonatronum sp. SC1]
MKQKRGTIILGAPSLGSVIISWLPVVLSVIAALALSLEYWLMETGRGGLCPTAGCAVVGTFVKFGEKVFIGLGVIFFWLLAGALFLARQWDKSWLWLLIAIILTAGLAFDGGILGFQRFGIQEACVLCYAVGVALLLILLAFGAARKSLAAVVMGLAVWTAAFASQAMFLFPERTPDLRETVLVTHRADTSTYPQLYYFFSLHCPFCTHVLASLATHPPVSGEWNLVPLDTQPEDQRKLTALLDLPETAGNPFQAILLVEQSAAPDIAIQPQVTEAARKGGTFLRNSGFRGVPLLIIQETPTKRVVLQGRDPILNYLLEKRIVPFRLFF